MSEAVCLSD